MLVILSTLINLLISVIIALGIIILGGPPPCQYAGGEECFYLGGVLFLLSIPLGFIITSVGLIIGIIKQMRNPQYRLSSRDIKILLILSVIVIIEIALIRTKLFGWI